MAKGGGGAGGGWVAAEAVAAEAAAAAAMAAREGSTAEAVAAEAVAAEAAAVAARGSQRARGKRRCTHFQTREIRCRRGMRGASIMPGMDLKCVCVIRTVQRGCNHAELQKHAVGG